jgi:hemerythrin
MAFLDWQPNFSVSVKEIDDQHQYLISLINNLYAAMQSGQDREALGKLINQLVIYAAMHFAKEEHYFDLLGYPESDAHKREHDAFEMKVTEFEDNFKYGKQDMSIDVMNFLCNWLVDHIKGSDKKYGPFLNERGIQ